MARYTGLKRSLMTVPARGTASFDFTTNQPNYFRVHNRGTGRIYGSTGSMPTQNNYEFYVDGEKVKLYAQPNASNRLYIYNPSGSDVTVVCVSFYAEFDPLAYALGDLEVYVPDAIQATSVISSFNTPLPIGNNTIGKVGLSSPIPAGSNKIGSVDVANLKDYSAALAEIGENTGGFLDNVNAWEESGASGTKEINSSLTGKVHIHVLSNDGDTDIGVQFTNNSNSQVSTFTLKAGETIQDLKFIGKVYLTGSNYTYRAMVSYF